ncbi:response regulator [Chromobacterium paludis]|uniref:Response regulator n=1 Tax=Chromobacterium paludis TaxID=2605945 RepID=A0A5C1DHJ3_9NEIS|nr:response regulator [Chromobacterium paludis]QEL56023.1 response regulator [Chromobacterium paludis]
MKKLLLVDDEPTNLNLLREILREQYQLLFATSGEDAIEAAQRHHPDLILLDVSMPGMDGFEVCRRLQSAADTAPIPILFVTAMAGDEELAPGNRPSVAGVVAKPVSRQDVLEKVAAACGAA